MSHPRDLLRSLRRIDDRLVFPQQRMPRPDGICDLARAHTVVEAYVLNGVNEIHRDHAGYQPDNGSVRRVPGECVFLQRVVRPAIPEWRDALSMNPRALWTARENGRECCGTGKWKWVQRMPLFQNRSTRTRVLCCLLFQFPILKYRSHDRYLKVNFPVQLIRRPAAYFGPGVRWPTIIALPKYRN